jgi:carbamoyltransferase
VKNILGISAGYHDAAVSLISSTGEILFAGHSERYSKKKNDADLHSALLDEIDFGAVDTIAYYEKPWKKQLRQWYSGQGIEWDKFTTERVLSQQLDFDDHCSGIDYLDLFPIKSYNHHLSHAAAGFQTSPYDRATVVVIDAIGEWDTISIWGASYDRRGRAQYKKLWRQTYPHSIGLFYSAITGRVGLRPLDEEYITMGMAAWGRPQWEHALELGLVDNVEKLTFKQNLHTGIAADFLPTASDEDLAASAQNLVERLIESVMLRARDLGWSQNLVYMGGVALNCLANRRLGQWFENIWIMPNPGDAGSSLGAAALAYGKKLAWNNAYLGHNIPGPYPVAQLLEELQTNKIAGVASGRAEFGPRALGNRSLLADPRGSEIKEKVNEIKRRQQFRPFAPVILEEHVKDYFDMPGGWVDSRYMQIVGQCLHPDLFPAVVHIDGTSRIQTVPKDGSGIRRLLESWYALTGCPMLLNTSLNIRGEPMVNDRADADRFEQLYGVRVCS